MMAPLRRVAFVLGSRWRVQFQRPPHFAQRFRDAGIDVVVFDVSGLKGRVDDWLHPRVAREQAATARTIWTAVFPSGMAERHPRLGAHLRERVVRSFDRFAARYLDDDTLLWLQGVNLLIPPDRLFSARRRMAVVDVCDDYAGFFEGAPDVQAELVRREEETVRRADGVIVTAPRLGERLAAPGRRILLARNGVTDRFLEAERAGANARPVAVYQGAFADWVDFELLEAAIDRLPGVEFRLMGRVFPSVEARVRRLAERPNVRFLGLVPHADLPRLLADADAGLIPFRLNPLTLATDPIKLYEYLGAGLPVVSTPLPEVTPWRREGVVEIAAEADAFVTAIQQALASRLDPQLAAGRRGIAADNTWDRRFQDVRAFLGA